MDEQQILNIDTDLVNSVINNQKDIIKQNNDIINQNKELLKVSSDIKFIKDYFEITPQEQKKIDERSIKEKDLQIEQHEKDKIQEREELIDFMSNSPYYKQMGEIKEQLVQLNELNNKDLEVSSVSSGTSYLLLFGVVITVLCYGIYRCFIKPFIY